MADYFSVIHGAVQNLDPNTVGARRETYERARKAMLGRLRSVEPVLPIAVIDAELATLNEAIERVEALFADATAGRAEGPRRRILAPLLAAVAGLVLAIVVTLGVLIWWPKMSRDARREPAQTAASYVYLRQPVFYRTTHPVGSILIDKAQRFLYVVLPNVVALRYGIGGRARMRHRGGALSHLAQGGVAGPRAELGLRKNPQPVLRQPRRQSARRPRALFQQRVPAARHQHAGEHRRRAAARLHRVLNDVIIDFYDKAPIETRVVVMD